MSLKRIERLWHSFTLRLSLWYAATFTFSAIVLFGLLYFLLISFFDRSEREIIQERLKECAAVYESGGLRALKDTVNRRQFTENEGPFFVEVTGPLGNVALLVAPANSSFRRISTGLNQYSSSVGPQSVIPCETYPSQKFHNPN